MPLYDLLGGMLMLCEFCGNKMNEGDEKCSFCGNRPVNSDIKKIVIKDVGRANEQVQKDNNQFADSNKTSIENRKESDGIQNNNRPIENGSHTTASSNALKKKRGKKGTEILILSIPAIIIALLLIIAVVNRKKIGAFLDDWLGVNYSGETDDKEAEVDTQEEVSKVIAGDIVECIGKDYEFASEFLKITGKYKYSSGKCTKNDKTFLEVDKQERVTIVFLYSPDDIDSKYNLRGIKVGRLFEDERSKIAKEFDLINSNKYTDTSGKIYYLDEYAHKNGMCYVLIKIKEDGYISEIVAGSDEKLVNDSIERNNVTTNVINTPTSTPTHTPTPITDTIDESICGVYQRIDGYWDDVSQRMIQEGYGQVEVYMIGDELYADYSYTYDPGYNSIPSSSDTGKLIPTNKKGNYKDGELLLVFTGDTLNISFDGIGGGSYYCREFYKADYSGAYY